MEVPLWVTVNQSWAAPVDEPEHQPRGTLQDVVCGARLNQNIGEAQMLEFITEFQDVFTKKGSDFGHMDRVYHWIDSSDAQPICQPPRRLLSAEQVEMNNMLYDMKERGVIEE